MRRTTTTTLIGAAALAATAVACQPAGQQAADDATAVDTAAIMATFDSMRTAFEEAFAAADVEAMAALYAEDAIYSEPGRPPVHGRDSIQALLSRTHPEGATIEITPTDVMVLSNDWVYEFGTGTVSVTPEGAGEAVEMPASYSALFRRTPDGWRLYREALSSNAPPPGSGGQ